jgi:hypothetical protein
MGDASSEHLEDWLLALLRYAITRHEADRIAVHTLAKDMDALGGRFSVPGFDFFCRSSQRLCDAIESGDPQAHADIEQFLKRIESTRLRHAFEAVLDLKSEAPKTQCQTQSRAWLWKGLQKA